MNFWTPIIFSFLIIFVSSLYIKSSPVSSFSQNNFVSPTIINGPTSSPTPYIVPTINNSQSNNSYLETYAKCGEIPLLSDYSSTRFPGDYSLRTWSPTCRFIAWSATIKYSFGQWSASQYEGLFLYDVKTQKTTRLYTPASAADIVTFKNWVSDTTFIFHKSLDNSDYLYDVPTQSINKL
jgi:hypothetical protein